ncbi:PREDICTED: cytochrome P450 9e2-like [Ceratosolen solmsi marchali]|uniref:Cytochrome P450 9e2-like n=1 Tax=Ceratosolen solmsi marchali TaxID=326594 RepID=A0AAJ6YM06_9HYME|nr:PREDICTED: cytochrome P450 9e2-like [Ceratosolen solmsi marchali]
MAVTGFALVSVVLILFLLYWFLTKTFNHWEKCNIPYLRNAIPGFGHLLPLLTLRENIALFSNRVYKMSDSSMTGFYFLRQPALLVRDPELIKSILLSNFSSFRNNGIVLNEDADPVLSKNPFFTGDYQAWKIARARVSNNLSKLKLNYLFVIVNDVISKMVDFIDKKIEKDGSVYECELKKEFSRYTGEVVANAAFAINGQSFSDNPDKLAFTNVANTLFDTNFINGIKQMLIFFLPNVARLLRVNFLQKSTDLYLRENLKAIIKQRKQENSQPKDFLQFCIDSNTEDNIDGIISDVIVFYLDVLETTSTVLSILFYHLSENPDVQEKLRAHVNSVLKETDGVLTFESLKNMDYLEATLNESLRLLPPFGVLTKFCTKEITLTGSDNLSCVLRPDDRIFISLNGLHSDSKYWPEPHIFNPERFTKENQNNITKFTFLGFGEGPRICAGMRFAMILVKVATATLLSKYSIEHSQKTKLPFQFVTTSFITYIQGGLWAKVRKLSESNENDV